MEIIKKDLKSFLILNKLVSSPLKRVLKIQPLQLQLDQDDDVKIEENTKNLTNALAFILENNTIVIFSQQTRSINFEIKTTESSVI